MSALRPDPRLDSGDRLLLMLFAAAVVHVMAIIGIGFDFLPDRAAPPPQLSLDITLVHHRDEAPPEQADFLAQANQDGGGDTADNVRPQGPVSNPNSVPEPGDDVVTTVAIPPPPPPTPAPRVLARDRPQAVAKAPPPPPPPVEEKPLPRAAELIQRSRQMASLAAEIRDRFQQHSRRPRKTQVTSRTREYHLASYMEAWRAKVERIGNLNYPDEAKRRRLSGSLMLQVDLNPDGSILDVVLLRSSGTKILDDAAIRIVRLAAPYAPFPESIRRETDVLQIIRTWQFLTDNRLSSG